MNLKRINGMLTDLAYNSRYYRKMYHAPLQEKCILVESKNGGDLAGNMLAILRELSKESYADYELYLSYTERKKDTILGLLARYNVQGVILVRTKTRKYFKLLATAKYLFTDTSFLRDFVKREGQIITNTWHGTPMKYMGVDVKNRIYAIGNVQRNLMCADYLVYPNEYMKEKMTQSYLLDKLYGGTILNEGYPRNSCFFDPEVGKNIRTELGLEGKTVALYMPTWRGTMTKKTSDRLILMMEYYLRPLDYMLQDNQVLYVKMHPFVHKSMDFSRYQHILPYPEEYDAYEFLNMSDVLITDYSSVFYDFANTGKKIILFPYDESQYVRERGLYVMPEEMCFPVVKNTNDLYREIVTPKNYDDTEFRRYCCTYDAPDAASRICRHVVLGEKCCSEERLQGNGKENVLVFFPEAVNGEIPESVKSVLAGLDEEKSNIYFSFRENSMKKNPLGLGVFPEYIGFVPISSEPAPTWLEMICTYLYKKNRLFRNRITRKYKERFDKREFQKHLGGMKLDRIIQCKGKSSKGFSFFDVFEGANE